MDSRFRGNDGLGRRAYFTGLAGADYRFRGNGGMAQWIPAFAGMTVWGAGRILRDWRAQLAGFAAMAGWRGWRILRE